MILRSSEDKYKMAGQTERSTDQSCYEVSANLLRRVKMIFSNSRVVDGWVCALVSEEFIGVAVVQPDLLTCLVSQSKEGGCVLRSYFSAIFPKKC